MLDQSAAATAATAAVSLRPDAPRASASKPAKREYWIECSESAKFCHLCKKYETDEPCQLYSMFRKGAFLKKSSARTYQMSLLRLCEHLGLTLKDVRTLDIDELGDMFSGLVDGNKTRVDIAWKYVNVMLNALKTYLWVTRRIKNRRMFPEIKFPKTQCKVDPINVKTPQTQDVRAMFLNASGTEDIVLGFSALMGLRPSLVFKLRVGHLRPEDYELTNGKIRFRNIPPMVVVPQTVCKCEDCSVRYKCEDCKEPTKEPNEGNKANMNFCTFIPSVIAERLLVQLNRDVVTPWTSLTSCRTVDDVTYIIKKHYAQVGLKTAPYQLRSYADRMILKRIETEGRDKNLKEFMLGHKVQDISFIYDIKGLSDETVNAMRTTYMELCEKWINETVFNIISKTDQQIAEAIAGFAIAQGVPKEHADDIKKLLFSGKMSLDQFRERLTQVTLKTNEDRARAMVKSILLEELKIALPNMQQKEPVIAQ